MKLSQSAPSVCVCVLLLGRRSEIIHQEKSREILQSTTTRHSILNPLNLRLEHHFMSLVDQCSARGMYIVQVRKGELFLLETEQVSLCAYLRFSKDPYDFSDGRVSQLSPAPAFISDVSGLNVQGSEMFLKRRRKFN